MGEAERTGVVLGEGVSGGGLLRALLEDARASFPTAFGELALPAPGALRARIAELLPRFELARLQHADRARIARWFTRESTACLRFVDDHGERSLGEELASDPAPLPLVQVTLASTRGFTPRIDFGGRTFIGDQLGSLASELARQHVATRAATLALTSLGERVQDGGVSLHGERFVLIGAGAELSPVYALLEAGADVLWLDTVPPPVDRLLEPRLGGSLSYVAAGADVLQQPAALRSTIAAFAAAGPVRVVMLAFASGQARALRLALAMNALVRSLPPARVASLHYLLSPTSVGPVSSEDARCAEQRRQRVSSVWQTLLRSRAPGPGHVSAGGYSVAAGVVSAQGLSYQLAEYVAKRLAAEAFSAYGSALVDDLDDASANGAEADHPAPTHGSVTRAPSLERRAPLGVTADMLPVSATRSLAHPRLAAAVLGAPRFDMLIAAPSTAAAVGSSLLVQALVEPPPAQPPAAARDALFSRQFHGGMLAQPFALESLVRMAALRGMAQRPTLALELLR